MTRQEYLAELSSNLMSLSAEEREDAVRFYDEYFEDAGAENEAAVMEELGKPYNLAKSIICEQSAYSKSRSYAKLKASRSMNINNNTAEEAPQDTEPDRMPGEPNEAKPHTQYTAYNYSYDGSSSTQHEAKYTGDTASQNYDTSYEAYKENYRSSASSGNTYTSAPNSGSSNIVTFILGLVFGAIFGIPILLFLIFVFIGFGILAVIMAVSAVIGIILGIIGLITSFGTGMFLIGVSIFAAGLGLILCVPAILGIFKFIPWIFKQIIKFFKKSLGGAI